MKDRLFASFEQDFATIASNVRWHPECHGSTIECIQLFQPETLLVDFDRDYSENELRHLFDNARIFHIKMYAFCAIVHFHSYEGKPIVRAFDNELLG